MAFFDERRRRLLAVHRLSDAEIKQIIAFNRWLLWVLADEKFSRSGGSAGVHRSTWSDRLRYLLRRSRNG